MNPLSFFSIASLACLTLAKPVKHSRRNDNAVFPLHPNAIINEIPHHLPDHLPAPNWFKHWFKGPRYSSWECSTTTATFGSITATLSILATSEISTTPALTTARPTSPTSSISATAATASGTGVAASSSSGIFTNTSSASAATSSSAALSSAESAGARSSCSTATPPQATQAGIVSGCTKWYTARPGDFCYTVAQEFGISVDTFMGWNPAVDPPACPNMLAGYSYCVATCGSPSAAGSSSAAASSTPAPSSSAESSSAAPSSAAAGTSSRPPGTLPSPGIHDKYVNYQGDGSVADGWPSKAQWLDFDFLFNYNKPNMKLSCQAWGVPNDSDQEIAEMKRAILSVSKQTGVDARFILAIIMQESTGCVRVITTAYSHANPGLMQSFNGTGSCNGNNGNVNVPGVSGSGIVQTPCPASEIHQMVQDGTAGTIWGPGLQQDFQGLRKNAQGYYRVARIYNGGSYDASDLSKPCCTASYASDVANRLLGWAYAPRQFGY